MKYSYSSDAVIIFNCFALDVHTEYTDVMTVKLYHTYEGIQDFSIGYAYKFESPEEARIYLDMRNCMIVSHYTLSTIRNMLRNKRNVCHYVEKKHLEEVKVEVKNKLGLTLSLL